MIGLYACITHPVQVAFAGLDILGDDESERVLLVLLDGPVALKDGAEVDSRCDDVAVLEDRRLISEGCEDIPRFSDLPRLASAKEDEDCLSEVVGVSRCDSNEVYSECWAFSCNDELEDEPVAEVELSFSVSQLVEKIRGRHHAQSGNVSLERLDFTAQHTLLSLRDRFGAS